MGRFVISKDKAGKWRWKLVADNNETVAVSEGYETRQGAQHGIEAVQRLAADATITDKEENVNPGQGKGQLKKKDDVPPVPTPPAEPDTPDPSTVTLRDDGTEIYADAAGFPPGEGLSCNINSDAAQGNPNNEGIGVSLYKTTDANGSASFHASKDWLVPDTPRIVTARAFDGQGNSATDTLDFP